MRPCHLPSKKKKHSRCARALNLVSREILWVYRIQRIVVGLELKPPSLLIPWTLNVKLSGDSIFLSESGDFQSHLYAFAPSKFFFSSLMEKDKQNDDNPLIFFPDPLTQKTITLIPLPLPPSHHIFLPFP